MKKSTLWIVVAIVALGLMMGASVLYNNLSENYEHAVPQLPSLTTPPNNQTDEKDQNQIDNIFEDDNDEEMFPDASESDQNAPTQAPDTSGDTDDSGDQNIDNDNDFVESETSNDATESEAESFDKEPEAVVFNAPDFTFYDVNLKPVKLSDFAGKPIVLNIWASWCGPCQAEMPDFNEMYKKYPNVQFLMVNATATESMAEAKQYIDGSGFEFPVYYDIDGGAFSAYNISGFPTTILITRGGDLVYNQAGMLTAYQLEGVINQLVQID